MPYTLFSVADFGSGRAGLATVGYRLWNSNGTGFSTRVAMPAGEITDGKYGALITYPTGFIGAVIWDSGESPDPIYVTEVINPETGELLKKLNVAEPNVIVLPPPVAGAGARLQFGIAKDILRRVTAGGVCDTDERVMQWTNEAQLELLSTTDPATGLTLIPVGCMMTVDIVTTGRRFLLPKELKNVIEIEVVDSHKQVLGQSDVRQGWYDIINPFTYVDPNLVHDNPLIDLGFEPDRLDQSIQLRRYEYPGLDLVGPTDPRTGEQEGATVRVTGVKAYLPITDDAHYLTIQNLPALKMMMMGIDARENGDPAKGQAFKDIAVKILVDEAKAFMLDPKQTVKRRAGYEADLVRFAPNSFGYMRARLALEIPQGLQLGKSELTRLLEASEQRLMAKCHAVGTLEEFQAEVDNGRILAPERVQTIVAASIDGCQLDIRNIFFQYQKNGPGRECATMLIDEGEHYIPKTKKRYRQYRLGGDMMVHYTRSTAAASVTGVPGPPGPPGPPGSGIPGTQLLTGYGAPSDSLGIENDSYLDFNTFDFYKKQGGTFVLLGNLKGPPGTAGGSAESLPVVLDLEGLDGVGEQYLSGYNIDAGGVTPPRTLIVTIGDLTSFYQLQAGEPDAAQLDVPVNSHGDWRYRRTGS